METSPTLSEIDVFEDEPEGAPTYEASYEVLAHADIEPDPEQPRKEFNQAKLEELASSIRARGVQLPIIVRPHPEEEGKYIITDGERRWRATALAELAQIPCIIRKQERNILADQITANLHRENMPALNEANGIQKLIAEARLAGHKDPRKEVEKQLGLSPSQLSKKLAVLKYPEVIRKLLEDNVIRDYQTMKNLSMLKQDEQDIMVAYVKTPAFNAREFNSNPQKYARMVVKAATPAIPEGAAENSGVSRGTGEKSAKRDVVARWHMTAEDLARLIEATDFREAVVGVDVRGLSEAAAKGIFDKFRQWLNDVGEEQDS